MSIATATPTPQSTPARTSPATAQRAVRHNAPDWLPVIGWFVDDGRKHTRIHVLPLGNTTDPNERFTATLKFLRGEEKPVHTHVSAPFCGAETFCYESQTLLADLREKTFEGLVEITVRSLDKRPEHFPWLDSWLEFYADDGTFSGSVPGFVFKGGTTKRVMSGKWQHWPGALANDHFRTSVLLLNYHPRPLEARIDLFSPDGRNASSGVLEVPARLPRTFHLEEVIPEARALLETYGGCGSLRIYSAYKLPGFVVMENRRTGVVSSFDHTVPFAGTPVD